MNTENDQDLEDQQLSSIYKQTQQSQPAKHIDDAILAAAKRATTRCSTGPFSNSWYVPASLAAVLVISIGLVNFIDDDISSPLVDDDVYAEGITSQANESQILEKSLSPSIVAKQIAPQLLLEQTQKTISTQKAKKEIHAEMARSKTIRQPAKQSLVPRQDDNINNIYSLDSIKTLRLAGKNNAANKAIDDFIRFHFGNNVHDIEPQKIKLSTEEWNTLINELRTLSRNDLANKLEALLVLREKLN